jgi:hypothetical protein
MDSWHHEVDPLLTAEEESRIRQEWPTAAGGPAALTKAYTALFPPELQQVFPVGEFEESLEDAGMGKMDMRTGRVTITLEEGLRYIRENQ